jgi:hypothetical protein
VASGSKPLSESAFSQAMSAMDSVAAESDIADTPPHAPNAASHLNCTIPIRCPDRPIKKGRPANSSLKSWNDEQKRKQRDVSINHALFVHVWSLR